MSTPSDSELHVYLCEVIRVTERYAELRPLAQAAPDISRWTEMLDQAACARLFPNTGSILWFEPPQKPLLRSVWEVKAGLSPTFQPGRAGSARFRSVGATPAVELIDFRSMARSDTARDVLTVEGLGVTRPPAGTSYAWCSATETIGPLVLTSVAPGKWKVDAAAILKPIRVWQQPDADAILEIQVDGASRFFTTVRSRPSKLLGKADWADDKTLLLRVLQDLRRVDKEYADAVGLTHQAVKRYAELLAAEEAVADPQLANQRMARARFLIAGLARRLELEEDVSRGMLELPAAKATLAAGLERARQDLRSEMQREITEHEAQLAALDSRRTALETELKDLGSRLQRRKDALASEIEMLEEDMAKRLTELTEQPLKLLTDAFLARVAAHPFSISVRTGSSGFQDAVSTVAPTVGAGAPIADIQELLASLQAPLVAQGFTKSLSRILVAALLSGMIPVLRGASTTSVLRTVARYFSSARSTWVETPSSAYRVEDLLTSGDGGSAPHPNDLLRLLLGSANAETIQFAVISGANRAPIETYLSPLLDVYADAAGVGGRGLELNGSSRLERWPSSVLLALTVTDGPTVFPIPEHVWAHCIPIGLDEFTTPNATTSAVTDAAARSITSATYADWRAKLSSIDCDAFRQLVASLTGRRFDPTEIDAGRRFFAALRILGLREGPALKYSAALCVAPLLSSRGEDYPDQSPFDQDVVKRTWSLVRTLSA